MSLRCACVFSLPILAVYLLAFFMPAWQDGNGVYLGFETLGRGFDLARRSGDLGSLFLLLIPNLLACIGIVMLAIPATWARIVAASTGCFALVVSAQIMVCVSFLTFLSDIASAMFGSSQGPSGVREGFYVWILSMFAVMITGLVTAIVGGTGRARPDPEEWARRQARYDEDDRDDDYRRRRRNDDDDDYPRRGRDYDEDRDDGPFTRRR